MNFSLERIAFLFCNGQVRVQDRGDHRACEEWALSELNLSHSEWANSVRGYMLPERIQFFTGENYRADLSVTDGCVQKVKEAYKDIYGTECDNVFNGVNIKATDTLWGAIYRYDVENGGWSLL